MRSPSNGPSRPMEADMKKWKPILALVLVFLAGLALGIVGTRVVTRRVIRAALQNPELVALRIERDLVRGLKLNEEQKVKVHATLVDAQKQLQELRTDFQPRFLVITSNAQEHISQVLTPEQREKFDKMRGEHARFFPPVSHRP